MFNKKKSIFEVSMSSKLASNKFYHGELQLPDLTTNVEKNVEATTTNKSDELKRVFTIWLNYEYPFFYQSQVFELAGIRNASKQIQLKKTAIANNFILEHKIQRYKNHLSIWEPTEIAYELTNTKKRKFPSKGKYLHQFISFHINEWAKHNNFICSTEFYLTNNKAVDEMLTKDGQTFFIEIAISNPLRKEINNLIKNLQTNLLPVKMIVAGKSSSANKKLISLIKAEKQLDGFRDNIEIILAGDFIAPYKNNQKLISIFQGG